MQAYATAERLSPEARLRSLEPEAELPGQAQLRSLEPEAELPGQAQQTGATFDLAVMDRWLRRLADLVVDRLMERTTANAGQWQGEWLDARGAADYLGIHRDTLRKLAAERGIPVHQDGPGCKLYFRRGELDDWRRSSKAARSRLRAAL